MDEPTSSLRLLEKLDRGDSHAFSLLYERYRRRLTVLIHYKIGPEIRGLVEVEDVIQEVFLTAFRDVATFEYRGPGSFMSWLSRIADHVIADIGRHHNRLKRRASHTVPFRSESNPQGPEPADTITPSRIFARQEAVQQLLDSLEMLPDGYRNVILLAKVEGLTTREISHRLGKSRQAVSLLLHRAIRRYRELHAPGS